MNQREVTVRFFLDAKTGIPQEVRMNVLFQERAGMSPEGLPVTLAAVWFSCTCEEFDESNWCDHAEDVESDFDPETGTLYGTVNDSFEFFEVHEGESREDAENRFRLHLIKHSSVEVL